MTTVGVEEIFAISDDRLSDIKNQARNKGKKRKIRLRDVYLVDAYRGIKFGDR